MRACALLFTSSLRRSTVIARASPDKPKTRQLPENFRCRGTYLGLLPRGAAKERERGWLCVPIEVYEYVGDSCVIRGG